MEFHVCTFEIKLQYVKSQGQNKWGSNPIKATWKSIKQQVIITSNSYTFKNSTAWFNEIFQFKTDLIYDSRRNKYEKLIIYLQIQETKPKSNFHYTLTVDLGQLVMKKIIPLKQYQVKGQNLIVVALEKQCLNSQTSKNHLLRKIIKGERRQINKLGNIQLFLQKPKLKSDKQFIPQIAEKPIQVPPLLKKYKTEIVKSQSQDKSREVSLQQQQQQQQQQKVPQVLQISQISSQLFHMQDKLEKLHTKNHKIKIQFYNISVQLAQAEKQCNLLSAGISQRQQLIFQLHNQISALKQINKQLEQRIVDVQPLILEKYNLQSEVINLKQLIKIYKNNETNSSSAEIQMKRQLQSHKKDLTALKNTIAQLNNQIQKNNQVKNMNQALIKALYEEKQDIRSQVSVWRRQWAIQHQKTKEQLNSCQALYSKLLKRYTQLRQKYRESKCNKISQQLFIKTVEQYKAKQAQQKQKSKIFKEQFAVIEEQIYNLHQLLQDKEENEQQLLDHIKKLQYDLQTMELQSQWWDQVACNQIQVLKTTEENENNQQMKIMIERNRQLMQLLQQNSFVILESEKIKRELIRVQRQNEQLQKRQSIMRDEIKQMKQKIGILLKQSKKLQDKNNKLGKQKQALSQKNLWLSDETINITNSFQQKNDYIEALTFRLSQCEKQIQNFKKYNQAKKTAQQKSINSISDFGGKYQQQIMAAHNSMNKDRSGYSFPLQNFENSKTIQQFEDQRKDIILSAINGLSQTIEDRIIDSNNFEQTFQKMKAISPHKYFHQQLNRQIQKMEKTSNKVKIYLMKNGLAELFKELQQSLQSLRNQTDKILIIQ